jgi:hypothetical protein
LAWLKLIKVSTKNKSNILDDACQTQAKAWCKVGKL